MRIENKGKYLEVTPNDGMMLYNGETVSDGLIAPLNTDLSKWREVTIEEAQKIQKNENFEII